MFSFCLRDCGGTVLPNPLLTPETSSAKSITELYRPSKRRDRTDARSATCRCSSSGAKRAKRIHPAVVGSAGTHQERISMSTQQHGNPSQFIATRRTIVGPHMLPTRFVSGHPHATQRSHTPTAHRHRTRSKPCEIGGCITAGRDRTYLGQTGTVSTQPWA